MSATVSSITVSISTVTAVASVVTTVIVVTVVTVIVTMRPVADYFVDVRISVLVVAVPII